LFQTWIGINLKSIGWILDHKNGAAAIQQALGSDSGEGSLFSSWNTVTCDEPLSSTSDIFLNDKVKTIVVGKGYP
jgi:hypothetical protein